MPSRARAHACFVVILQRAMFGISWYVQSMKAVSTRVKYRVFITEAIARVVHVLVW